MVYLPLWKIWKSMGRMTSHIWNGKIKAMFHDSGHGTPMIKPLEDSQFEESHKTKQRGEGKRLSPLKTSGEKTKLKTTTCKSVTTGCPTKPPCTINSIIYIYIYVCVQYRLYYTHWWSPDPSWWKLDSCYELLECIPVYVIFHNNDMYSYTLWYAQFRPGISWAFPGHPPKNWARCPTDSPCDFFLPYLTSSQRGLSYSLMNFLINALWSAVWLQTSFAWLVLVNKPPISKHLKSTYPRVISSHVSLDSTWSQVHHKSHFMSIQLINPLRVPSG